eukprot:scaffold22004_cov92-Isochrysis_galbana.AAC.5
MPTNASKACTNAAPRPAPGRANTAALRRRTYQLRLMRGSSCGAFSFRSARRCSSSVGARVPPSAPITQMSLTILPCLRLPETEARGSELGPGVGGQVVELGPRGLGSGCWGWGQGG